MDVDIDHVGRHVERQKDDRLAAGEQQAPVSLLDRMQDRAIAERPAGDKKVLKPRACHIVFRSADEAVQGHFSVVGLDLDQPIGHRHAKETANPFPPRRHRRQVVDNTAVVRQRHRHPRMGQSGADKRLG